MKNAEVEFRELLDRIASQFPGFRFLDAQELRDSIEFFEHAIECAKRELGRERAQVSDDHETMFSIDSGGMMGPFGEYDPWAR